MNNVLFNANSVCQPSFSRGLMGKLVLLLALILLPLQAPAQHVVTRKTTTKQKTESKPTTKRQPAAAKSQSNRSNSNAKPMTERSVFSRIS